MADYISREEAIKELREVYEQEYPTASGDFDEYASHDVPNVLRNMPAADVQPIRHGRWIEKPPYKDETVKGLEFQIVCSECDEQNCSLEFDENYNAIGKTFYKTRYCPNCGARMDGDKE